VFALRFHLRFRLKTRRVWSGFYTTQQVVNARIVEISCDVGRGDTQRVMLNASPERKVAGSTPAAGTTILNYITL
jgi:hypothetical protein